MENLNSGRNIFSDVCNNVNLRVILGPKIKGHPHEAA